MLKGGGMRQRIILALVLALFCVQAPVLAKDEPKAKPAVAQPGQAAAQVDPAQQKKDILAGNINFMRSQQIRVAVLQQVFNEEVDKLKNVEEAFCKEYKLDVDKFRKGLYRYDEKQEKFIEVKQ